MRSSTIITGLVFSLARIFQEPLWVSEVTPGTPTSSCSFWRLLGIKDFAIWQVKVKLCVRKSAYPRPELYAHPPRQAAALGPTEMPRDHAQDPVMTSRERLLVQCTGQCGLSFNLSVGEGTVGVLDRETCNFSWEPSKMGSQEMTLELGREGHVGSLPSGEGGGKTAFQGDRTVCAGGRGGPVWGPRLNRRWSVWLDARCPCSFVGTHHTFTLPPPRHPPNPA